MLNSAKSLFVCFSYLGVVADSPHSALHLRHCVALGALERHRSGLGKAVHALKPSAMAKHLTDLKRRGGSRQKHR